MRTLAFGDPQSRVWGAAWNGFACVGAGDASQQRHARLDGEDPTAEWRLVGDGVELTTSPLGEAVGEDGFDQLCRVSGSFELGGAVYAVHTLGRRGTRTPSEEFESIREVSAWFDPDGGLALVAVRPRGARGQEADLVTAAVLDLEGPKPVADPRLSTTYDADGRPARAGLELWLSDGENEFPLRAAGEALGPRATASDGGVEVQAQLFRWYSRNREGAGVYLLARPR